MYSMRRATSNVRGQCVWLEEKVYIIWNFTSAVRVEKCALPEGSHLQYDSVGRECVISEGLHLSQNHWVSGGRRNSVISGRSHL